MWRIIDTKKGAVIIPAERINCYRCKETMYVHGFTVGATLDFYFCNVMLKCPRCDWVATFGVPIDEGAYDKLRTSQLHGKLLTADLFEIFSEEDLEKIREKMEKWGYW